MSVFVNFKNQNVEKLSQRFFIDDENFDPTEDFNNCKDKYEFQHFNLGQPLERFWFWETGRDIPVSSPFFI